jgi:S1-C subfamily serine protease
VLLGAGLLAAALGGAIAARYLAPPQQKASTARQARPIVQIVREQPGLPDLADLIDRLCPSTAVIVAHGTDVQAPSSSGGAVPASVYSADGWLVTSAAHLPQGQLDALFSNGERVDLSDLRSDPVSGLAIVKAANPSAPPLAFSDEAFPRVGQFGFTLVSPAASGCSSEAGMIGSDFLADGGAAVGYVRLQQPLDNWAAGTPLIGTDGRVIGIATDDPAGAAIPAPIASVIIDELIRNSLSPSTAFGFRATDYSAPFSARLGDVRSGAGVALVEPKSAASRAGLQAGDVVTAVGDVPVSSASELSRALDAAEGKVALTVQRRSQQLTITIRRSSG